MTDTTDIKALREALCKLKSVEGLRTLAAESIDQLEAERQRAADAFILIGYAEDGKGFVYEPRHQDRISNPIAIYRRKDS